MKTKGQKEKNSLTHSKMSEPILPVVNRALLIFRAKVSFLDWINALPNQDKSHGVPLSLDYINKDPYCFLIPNDCDPNDALEHYFVIIIHEIFSAWITDESFWPKKVSLKTFSNWFRMEWITLLQDCNSKEPLDYE